MADPADTQDTARPRVDLGWLVHAVPATGLGEAVAQAAARVERRLARDFPGFDWRVSVVPAARAEGRPADPVALLDTAERQRDAHGWDFVLVVTDDLLRGREIRFPRAVVSALLATAVVSARTLGEDRGKDALAGALAGLALHLFGRLNGLAPGIGAGVMQGPRAAAAWFQDAARDAPAPFDPAEAAGLRANLAAVSDLRVEEMDGQRPGLAAFYLRSVLRNRRALPRQILRMHPWSFPIRLTRLTTAAASALLVLMMTAESWEVAANLSAPTLVALGAAAILATSAWLLRAQRLLAREAGSLREQRAVRNVGTALAVLLGMGVTFLAAFLLVLALGALLFGDALLSGWTGAPPAPLRTAMAAFAAPLGLSIGALGASFEPYGHFRHVTHVEAEL